MVFDPRALRLLIDTLGERNVLLGSDYPYLLGVAVPAELIRASGLTEEQARLVLAGNAATFLGEANEPGGTRQTTAGAGR